MIFCPLGTDFKISMQKEFQLSRYYLSMIGIERPFGTSFKYHIRCLCVSIIFLDTALAKNSPFLRSL